MGPVWASALNIKNNEKMNPDKCFIICFLFFKKVYHLFQGGKTPPYYITMQSGVIGL
jgi:hypothetical protein